MLTLPGPGAGAACGADTHLFCEAGQAGTSRPGPVWAARARQRHSPHLGSRRHYPHEMAASSHSRHHQRLAGTVIHTQTGTDDKLSENAFIRILS